MVMLHDIVTYIDSYLALKDFNDASWNGLQVEGKQEIKKIAVAVDACTTTFEKAIEQQADMLIVHHGLFWQSMNPSLTGWKKERIKLLLDNNISLYAVHLPLDAHKEVGNNAQLLSLIGATQESEFALYGGRQIGWKGRFAQPKKLSVIEGILRDALPSKCATLPFGLQEISTVAVCSGGAGPKIFSQAIDAGVDLYISGEAIDIYQMARDARINAIFAGHYATETVGVKALAQVLQEIFSLNTFFIDNPTGL